MPIYEYRCESCSHELEKLQRMSDAKLTDCPECGKSTLKRLVSAAGFRLKGAGWYETDFKKTNQRNLVDSAPEKSVAKEPAKESKSTESSSPSKAEKPAKASSTPASGT